MTGQDHLKRAFQDARALGESLRNAEWHLGFLPAPPVEIDFEAVRTHLADVRIALGALCLDLSAAAVERADDEDARRSGPPVWMGDQS